jgi:hypothetical protein
MTRQFVLPYAVDHSGFGGFRLGVHDRPPLLGGGEITGLLERAERRLNAQALVFRYQAGKHLAEVRVLGARVDVLPAVSLQEGGPDRSCLGLVDRTAAVCREVTCCRVVANAATAVD